MIASDTISLQKYRRHTPGTGMYFCLLIYALIRLCPWSPPIIDDSLARDPSWIMALNEAFANRWHFGSEIAFTYGPYGFLHCQSYHPQTYSWLIGGWLFLAFVFFDCTWRLMKERGYAPLSLFCFCLAMLEIVSWSRMPFFFTIQLFFLVDHFYLKKRSRRFWKICRIAIFGEKIRQRIAWSLLIQKLRKTTLIFAFALLPLIKVTYLATGGLILSIVILDCLVRRKVPWIIATVPGAVLVLWLGAGQLSGDLIQYLRNGIEFSVGYGSAMATWETQWFQYVVETASAFLVVTIPILLFWAERKRYHYSSLLVGLSLLGLLFVAWKSAFVRYHDAKIAIFTCTALLSLGILIPLLNISEIPRKFRRVGAFLITAPFVAIGVAGNLSSPGLDVFQQTIGRISSVPFFQIRAFADTVTGSDFKKERYEQRLKRIRENNPLPPLRGTVDVLPHNLTSVIAAGLDYRPRPVFQSYVTYTPRLAELNARHFRSTRAPENILFRIDPLDGRFPSFAEGPSWLELLTRYRASEKSAGQFCLLKKRHVPGTYELRPLSTVRAQWGKSVPVPSCLNGPIWCTIKVRPTFTGRVMESLYKSPPARIHVSHRNGIQNTYRFIPGMAEEGFLLSPVIESKESFCRLMATNRRNEAWLQMLHQQELASLRLTMDTSFGSDFFYEREFDVSFSRLIFEPSGGPQTAFSPADHHILDGHPLGRG